MTRRDLQKNGATLLYKAKVEGTSWTSEYWQLLPDNPMQAYAGIYRTLNYPSVEADYCGTFENLKAVIDGRILWDKHAKTLVFHMKEQAKVHNQKLEPGTIQIIKDINKDMKKGKTKAMAWIIASVVFHVILLLSIGGCWSKMINTAAAQ